MDMQSKSHWIGRLEKLEEAHALHVNEMRETLKNIERALDRLTLIMDGVTEREQSRKDLGQKIYLFFIGSIVAAFMAFVYDGGLKK
jgi:hypothetical protein